jgi:hypothetical protein
MMGFGQQGVLVQRRAVLRAACDRYGSAGPRVVGFGGWIGGVGKTTAAAATTQLFSDMLAAPVDALDANPDKPLLRQRLLGGTAPGRMLEFIGGLDQIGTPMDLAPFLDSVGRLHLLHKDGVHTAAITQTQWTAVIDKLTGFAQLVPVDVGNSPVSAAAKAVLSRADHWVFCLRMDLTVFNQTSEGLAELAEAGFEDLIGTSTVVISTHDAKQKITPRLQHGIDQFAAGVGRVVLVPYDHAAGAVGRMNLPDLKPATQLSFVDMVEHISGVFTRPRRADHTAPAPTGSTSTTGAVTAVERSLLPAVPRTADEAESAS